MLEWCFEIGLVLFIPNWGTKSIFPYSIFILYIYIYIHIFIFIEYNMFQTGWYVQPPANAKTYESLLIPFHSFPEVLPIERALLLGTS